MNWSKILKRTVLVLLLVAVAFGVFLWAIIQTPKPQIASNAGKPAPAFTLKDQNGKDFALASLRGEHVLIIFYRGYW